MASPPHVFPLSLLHSPLEVCRQCSPQPPPQHNNNHHHHHHYHHHHPTTTTTIQSTPTKIDLAFRLPPPPFLCSSSSIYLAHTRLSLCCHQHSRRTSNRDSQIGAAAKCVSATNTIHIIIIIIIIIIQRRQHHPRQTGAIPVAVAGEEARRRHSK